MKTPSRLIGLFVPFLFLSEAPAETVTFENLLPNPGTFYNGDTGVTNDDGWTAGNVFFGNSFNSQFGGFWSGWSYSNIEDPSTPNFGNQYASAPGGGSDGAGGVVGGGAYGVAFGDGAFFNLPTGFVLHHLDWTNTTYAYLSMLNGDAANGSAGPGKQFGGPTGSDPDFFRVQLTGYSDLNLGGTETGSIVLSLADFTFPDSADDFVVSGWQVGEDLTSLGRARSVGLTFESSDTTTLDLGNGPEEFIDTPTYFAIDNLTLTAIPEPSSSVVLAAAVSILIARRRRVRD